MTPTKIAFWLFSAASIVLWSWLSWVAADHSFSFELLLMPGLAILACVLSVRVRKYDLGGTFAFVLLFAALPVMIMMGGGV